MIWPIQFSIPESLIVSRPLAKCQKFAGIVPGVPYSFDSQEKYYAEYRKSVFGLTYKKAGWDCLRHYEILAAGCIPWFVGLKDAPVNSMMHMPRWLDPSSDRMAAAYESPNLAAEMAEELCSLARERMTCRSMASYLIETASLRGVSRIAFIDANHADYLSLFTLIGLKELFGDSCVETPVHDWMYEDYAGGTSHLYGRGFSYTKHLKAEWRPRHLPVNWSEFDAVIYGAWWRSRPHWGDVVASLPVSRIVRIIGEDNAGCFPKDDYPTFVREW